MAQVDRFFENRPIEQKCGSCRWKDLLVACRILNRSRLSQVNQDLILKNVTLTEKKELWLLRDHNDVQRPSSRKEMFSVFPVGP